MKNKILGKGLSALISESNIDSIMNMDNSPKSFLSTKLLVMGKYQPRKIFDEGQIAELAESILKVGIISPIIVRPINKSEKYEIIAGERRWRASKIAGLEKVPVIIKHLSDKEALEIAIIENVQRENLTTIEEAESYARLMDEFGYKQEQLSKILGKSRSHIANHLRLLKLPDSVKQLVSDGSLSTGHAKALLTSEDPETMASEIIEKKLNVRDSEKLFQRNKVTNIVKHQMRNFEESSLPKEDVSSIEKSIGRALGMNVKIETEKNGNRMSIFFDNFDQLDSILQKLG